MNKDREGNQGFKRVLLNVFSSSGASLKSLKIVKIYYSESMLNGSRSITEPQVGHLAAMCGEILRTRGEEGLDDASDKLLQSSNGSITFIFVGRLGTIPLDLKNVTICCEMFANTSRA